MRIEKLPLALFALIALLGVATYSLEELGRGELGFPLDDSWIHLQFATSIAQGEGLSYRNGEIVAGSTSPLWTCLVALVVWLPGSELLWLKLLGAVLLVAVAMASRSLGEALGLDGRSALLVGCLVVATDRLVWSALSGMEILLFTVLTLWGMVVAQRADRNLPLAGLLFGLSALTRPEGALLGCLFLGDHLLRALRDRDRPPWTPELCKALIVLATLCVPVVLVGLLASGSALPTTFAVKTDGAARWLPSGRDLYSAFAVFFRSQPLLFLLGLGGCVAAVTRWVRGECRTVLPVLWIVTLPIAYSVLTPPGRPIVIGNFGRYLFPLFPLIVILGFAALQDLWRALEGRRAPRPLRWLVELTVALPTLLAFVAGAGVYATNVDNVNRTDRAAADWIARELPPEAVLAVQDIGAIGYGTPNPLVDLAGIVTPEALPYLEGDGVGPHGRGLGGLFALLRNERVDYVVLFPESYGGIDRIRAVAPDLGPVVERFVIDRNLTMAGSELVILSAPWGRAGGD